MLINIISKTYNVCYRPQRGYVFTGVCHSVNRGSALVHAGIPPRGGSRIPIGGGANPPGGVPTYDFTKFCEKLHEIEKILGHRGVHAGGGPPKSTTATPWVETPQEGDTPRRRPPQEGDPQEGDPHEGDPPDQAPPRPTSNGKIEGDQVQAHTQGEIEGDQVQATPKREIEGDQIQAHTQGEN